MEGIHPSRGCWCHGKSTGDKSLCGRQRCLSKRIFIIEFIRDSSREFLFPLTPEDEVEAGEVEPPAPWVDD